MSRCQAVRWHCTPSTTRPPEATAQAEWAPTDTEVTPESPLTTTGVVLFAVVPLPSCPWALYPQHLMPPPESTAQSE